MGLGAAIVSRTFPRKTLEKMRERLDTFTRGHYRVRTYEPMRGRLRMTQKRRLHDAIVGLLVTIGIALGHYVSAHWLLLPAAIGLTLLQSGVTGFCPVYFGLDRLLPAEAGTESASSCAT